MLDGGRTVYLHCRAGIGRTNLVAGCWMANRLGAGSAALEELNRKWRGNVPFTHLAGRPRNAGPGGVRARLAQGPRWPRRRRRAPPVAAQAGADLRDRVRGMLLGLAAGDALGHAIHGLPAGAWSDKTAMALCLAESLVSQDGPDAADQVARYREWQRAGFWSSTGSCVGISAATSRALAAAQWSGNPYSGSHDPAHADAEPLARIGPAVAWFHASPGAAIDAAVNGARVTHQAPLTLDAARFLAALLSGALAGVARTRCFPPITAPIRRHSTPARCARRCASSRPAPGAAAAPRRMLRGKLVAVAALESALTRIRGRGRAGTELRGRGIAPGRCGDGRGDRRAGRGRLLRRTALPREMRAALARADEIEALADRLVDAAPRARSA